MGIHTGQSNSTQEFQFFLQVLSSFRSTQTWILTEI